MEVKINTQLVQGVYAQRQDIEDFIGYSMIEVRSAEAMITATFGKIWNVEIHNFETTGDCRDDHRAIFNESVSEKERTYLDTLCYIVGTMFKRPTEISTRT